MGLEDRQGVDIRAALTEVAGELFLVHLIAVNGLSFFSSSTYIPN